MSIKGVLVSMGLGAAAGAVAVMMLPNQCAARRMAKKTANMVENVVEQAMENTGEN